MNRWTTYPPLFLAGGAPARITDRHAPHARLAGSTDTKTGTLDRIGESPRAPSRDRPQAAANGFWRPTPRSDGQKCFIHWKWRSPRRRIGDSLGAARAPQTGKKDAMSLSVEEMNKELPLANVLPGDA